METRKEYMDKCEHDTGTGPTINRGEYHEAFVSWLFNELKKENTELLAELKIRRSDSTEYKCIKCNVIHPVQNKNTIAQKCPVCGEVMVPTSATWRKMCELEAEVKELREKIVTVKKDMAAKAISCFEKWLYDYSGEDSWGETVIEKILLIADAKE